MEISTNARGYFGSGIKITSAEIYGPGRISGFTGSMGSITFAADKARSLRSIEVMVLMTIKKKRIEFAVIQLIFARCLS
jgi:hypothetical protein